MRILVPNDWMESFLDELKREFPSVEFISRQTPEEVLAAAAGVEVVFGQVDAELLAAARQLKWIQAGSAGVEWMERAPALKDTDIVVTNARGAHAATIAEHTFGLLVHLARRFDLLAQAQRDRAWLRPAPRSVGLSGLTMGIIGLGNIGRAIAVRARAFEMDVIAVDVHRIAQPEYVSELRLLDGLHDLLRRSDVAVVATPITSQTRGMLGPEQLALLQPAAYLLVVSRGGIVHEPTLLHMLRNGKLAGAGLDVTAVEPLPADSELWDAPNIIITPHNSPTSSQTQAGVTAILRRNLAHYLAGEPLENVVDKNLGY